MNDYLLESALSTLRGEIDKLVKQELENKWCDLACGARIMGMRKALRIMEDMMYEDTQCRIETSCA
jgi:hypothetical protein